MGETANQIESHIAAEREELRQNLVALDDKAKDTVSWRKQFETRPGTLLAIAFGVGVALAHVIRNRP